MKRGCGMKLSTKKASAAALCMLLTVCISPLQAFAATSVNVGAKDYTAAAAGTGWTWDGANNMALNNYKGGAIIAEGNLNIALSGTNTVTDNGIPANDAVGVYTKNGDLSISGNGSLDVSSTSDTENAYGIDADGSIHFTDATVSASATSTAKSAEGIFADGDIDITGSTVNASATSAAKSAYGIATYKNLTIADSTVAASATSTNPDRSAYVIALGAFNYGSNEGIVTISGSDVTAKAAGVSGPKGQGIVAYTANTATGVPQVIIEDSSVKAEGGEGAIVAGSGNASYPGIITITGSSVVAPARAHVQDVADSNNEIFGQTIGAGTGIIAQYWLDDGSLNPDVVTSVTIAKADAVAKGATATSPKTADEAPIALLVLSLATAGGALFVSRKKMAR